MHHLSTNISVVKNPDNPFSIRQTALSQLLDDFPLRVLTWNLHICIEGQTQLDFITSMPEELESLYSYSRSKLAETFISDDHLISLLFLNKIREAGHLGLQDIIELGNTMIDTLQTFVIQEDHFSKEQQFIVGVIEWMQNMLQRERWCIQNQVIRNLLDGDISPHQEILKLSDRRLHSENGFLCKIFFFLRINGINSETSKIFRRALSLVQSLNKRVRTVAHCLSNISIVRRNELTQLDIYQRVNVISNTNEVEQIMDNVVRIHSQMATLIQFEGEDSLSLLHIQKMLRHCQLETSLFRIITSLEDRGVCKVVFHLLSLYTHNNYSNAKQVIDCLLNTRFPQHFHDQGQYKLVSSVAKTGILSEPQYSAFVTGLISHKTYTPQSENQDFIEVLLLLSHSDSNKSSILKLIPNADALKILLNTDTSRRFCTDDILYATKCLSFLLNLKTTQETKVLSEAIGESLAFGSLFKLTRNRDFFVSPTNPNLNQLVYEISIWKLISTYSLYESVGPVLSQQLMITLKQHLALMRTYTLIHHQRALVFVESLPVSKQAYDILSYCSQFMYVLLTMAIHQMHSASTEEGIKLSLRRISCLVVLQINELLRVYLTQKEYQSRKGEMDKLLRVIHRDFEIDPGLDYYFNYNAEVVRLTQYQPNQTVFKREKQFMLKYSAERTLLEYFYSADLAPILEKEQVNLQPRMDLITSNNHSNFVYSLVSVLQEHNTTEDHHVILKMIGTLLATQKEETTKLLLEHGFVAVFYRHLAQSHDHLSELLEIAHILLRKNNQEINREVQQDFEEKLLQGDHTQVLETIAKLMKESVQLEKIGLPVTNSFEKHIRRKIANPEEPVFPLGIQVLIFVQFLCQSLNLSVKSLFGSAGGEIKSVLFWVISLIKVMTQNVVLMSHYRATVVIICLKTISNLIRGPHQHNIKRALYYRYSRVLMSLISIEDSLAEIIERVRSGSTKKELLSHQHRESLKSEQYNFYSSLVETQILRREETFDIKQISSLKSLALVEVTVLMDYFNRDTFKMFYDLARNSMIQFMEKVEMVYGSRDEDLENLITTKKPSSIIDRIIGLDAPSFFPSKQLIEREQIEESLQVRMGISLFIVMSKFEEKQKIDTIKESMYSYLSHLRLSKRYNQKGGILYQLFILARDLLRLVVGLLMRVFRVGKSILYYNDKENERSDDVRYQKAIDFFARNIATIEIRVDGKNTLVSFPLLLEERCINKSIRRDLTRNLNYSSNSERLSSFMDRIEVTLTRIHHQRKLSRLMLNNKILEILLKNRQLWKNLSFLVAVVQNVVLILKNRIPDEDYMACFYAARAWQYFLALLLILIYLFEAMRLRIVLAKEQLNRSKISYSVLDRAYILWFTLTDKTLLFALFYIIFTTLGMRWEVAVTVLLLDFFMRFKAARFLLQMVVQVWPSLLTNVIFFFTMLYLVVLLVGTYTSQNFFGVSCQGYSQCMQMMFYQTQKIEILESSDADYLQLHINGVVATTGTILLMLMYRGLFLGIMIDQKSRVRRIRARETKLIKEKCFVCGRSKAEINKKQNMEKGFKKHIEASHNLWNYIYYFSYISQLNSQQITVQEQIMLQKIRSKYYDWIPLQEADGI